MSKSIKKALKKISASEAVMPKSKPTIRLSSEELPEIKNWEVGEKYNLEVEVELSELSKGEMYSEGDSKKYNATFKIISVEEDNDKDEK